MHVNPYLDFNGRCEEALDFYAHAIDARVTMKMRFHESPDPIPPGMIKTGTENNVMHAEFRIGESVLMASDGYGGGTSEFKGTSLSLAADDEATATRYFNALAAGGKVEMPLGKTFWSPCFGMVTDRFGLMWMVTTTE